MEKISIKISIKSVFVVLYFYPDVYMGESWSLAFDFGFFVRWLLTYIITVLLLNVSRILCCNWWKYSNNKQQGYPLNAHALFYFTYFDITLLFYSLLLRSSLYSLNFYQILTFLKLFLYNKPTNKQTNLDIIYSHYYLHKQHHFHVFFFISIYYLTELKYNSTLTHSLSVSRRRQRRGMSSFVI